MDPRRIEEYQAGGEGFAKWAEENVCLSIPRERNPNMSRWVQIKDLPDTPHHITGRSWKGFWNRQKAILREALRMKDGDFVYRLIVFCWMRGEGKSLMVCLIQLWKFFCFPRQNIVLGANSKDQVRFVHYEIMRDIILNSPRLLKIVGKRNIQEKQISLRDRHGNIVSQIKAISSFSGIVSNITGYTFSEMFDMSNPKFFVQLDGSTRNIVNALGTIDSTVSDKSHILYKLYRSYMDGEDPYMLFDYRCSPDLDYQDFWHPLMTQKQLNSYAARFPDDEIDRYFKNTWEMSKGKFFTRDIVESIFTYEIDNVEDQQQIKAAWKEYYLLKEKQELLDGRKDIVGITKSKRTKRKRGLTYQEKLSTIEERLTPVDFLYSLHENTSPQMASVSDLKKLGRIYDTDWAILVGIDRADPEAYEGEANTIITAVAKGMPGSKTTGLVYKDDDDLPLFKYFLIHLEHVADSSLDGIKDVIRRIYRRYNGIDTLCAERWGTFDLAPWCDKLSISFESIWPNYEKQRAAFSELYTIASKGHFKSPWIYVPGKTEQNILHEELLVFQHDTQRRWYGSPHKFEKRGVQDDAVYSLGWTIFGGRNLSIKDFRELDRSINFGYFYSNRKNLHGEYRRPIIQGY